MKRAKYCHTCAYQQFTQGRRLAKKALILISVLHQTHNVQSPRHNLFRQAWVTIYGYVTICEKLLFFLRVCKCFWMRQGLPMMKLSIFSTNMQTAATKFAEIYKTPEAGAGRKSVFIIARSGKNDCYRSLQLYLKQCNLQEFFPFRD